MPASTQTAHEVNPYTNTSGKYVRVVQQYRSTLLAHPRLRMVREGDAGGDGEPSVAIIALGAKQGAYGANALFGVFTEQRRRDGDPFARGSRRRRVRRFGAS